MWAPLLPRARQRVAAPTLLVPVPILLPMPMPMAMAMADAEAMAEAVRWPPPVLPEGPVRSPSAGLELEGAVAAVPQLPP